MNTAKETKTKFLWKYLFEWELMEILVDRKSSLDSKRFIGPMYTEDQVRLFLKNYGLDPDDPVDRSELFGNFQEALQFIRQHFLTLLPQLEIPKAILEVTEATQLFLLATHKNHKSSSAFSLKPDQEKEDVLVKLWAEAILKIMHVLLHMDKDLRSNYFTTIQTQILDRFYRFIARDREQRLFLGKVDSPESIELVDFQTKAKKTRESVLIKLLHKAENISEELFDRVGVRFIVKNKFEVLRVLKFLIEKNIVIPHHLKTSRSLNTLFDFQKFRSLYKALIKDSIRSHWTEKEFLLKAEKLFLECHKQGQNLKIENAHTFEEYRSVQFTGRQLIRFQNPIFFELNELKKMARGEFQKEENNLLAKKILEMDLKIGRELRFFYPFETQIVDEESHRINTEGEASHEEYKKSQLKSALNRIFGRLLSHYGYSL